MCSSETLPFLPIPFNMDCVSDQHHRQMLQKYNMILAIEVVDQLKDIVFEQQCYGCSVGHPSQTQHPCIMETPLTHLTMYFEMTLEKVGRVSVINKWQKRNHPFGLAIRISEQIS